MVTRSRSLIGQPIKDLNYRLECCLVNMKNYFILRNNFFKFKLVGHSTITLPILNSIS